ncbi:MAG: hypothetical protein M1833_002184 [Piccolia ochrophora]|nr:MAG: hypothetical protein M1833_002184 [Piccolia ochrophora]
MPSKSLTDRPMTSRQAKREFQKRGGVPRLTEKQQRQQERYNELHERADRIKERERRKKQNRAKKEEKDRKERETRQRMGIVEPRPKLEEGQVVLNGFFRSTKPTRSSQRGKVQDLSVTSVSHKRKALEELNNGASPSKRPRLVTLASDDDEAWDPSTLDGDISTADMVAAFPEAIPTEPNTPTREPRSSKTRLSQSLATKAPKHSRQNSPFPSLQRRDPNPTPTVNSPYHPSPSTASRHITDAPLTISFTESELAAILPTSTQIAREISTPSSPATPHAPLHPLPPRQSSRTTSQQPRLPQPKVVPHDPSTPKPTSIHTPIPLPTPRYYTRSFTATAKAEVLDFDIASDDLEFDEDDWAEIGGR